MAQHGMFDLTGSRALVTGGSSGIGLAMAEALALHGADLVLWGRNGARLEAAAERLAPTGVDVLVAAVDVSQEQEVVQAMAATTKLGGIETLVVCAGMNPAPARFVDSTTEDFRAVMATNLDGAYWTMREGARVMVEQGRGGSIITLASLAAIESAGLNQAYGASKAGVVAMSNGAAVELARHGIRVNSVLPGWIATEMTVGAQNSQQFTDRVISRVPMRRWGVPEEFGGAAVYLASSASSFQTGSTMVVDGGYSLF